MRHIIPFPGSSSHIDAVYVVFTSVDGTLAAVRAAEPLAAALSVPVTVVHFRRVSFVLPVDEPGGISPVETDDFAARLRAEGIDARIRVYLCRDERRIVRLAFERHSLVVISGRHSWWPTRVGRLRRTLAAAGQLVIFVDAPEFNPRVPSDGPERNRNATEALHA